MSATTMHFGPEWMRPKHQSSARPQQPPSPPPANPPSASYSALVSPAPPNQTEINDDAHPFRYSKEDLLKIFKDGGGKGGLGLEVERWEGVVREYGSDPVGLREMGEAEKKLFAGPLNSDVRRRQSTDYLSPLSTSNLGSGGSRLNHNSSTIGSPMRERFGNKRRDSNADSPNPALPRKQSLSSLQAPAMSPREIGLPSPRARAGYTPSFDGVLGGGESWVARRRASEVSQKLGGSGDGDFNGGTEGIKEEKEEESGGGAIQDPSHGVQNSNPPGSNGIGGSQIVKDVDNLAGGVGQLLLDTNLPNPVDTVQNHSSVGGVPPGLVDPASVEWSYKDPTGTVQGPFAAELMQKWCDAGYFTPDLPMKRTHLDSTWMTLDQLRRRSATDKPFLVPLPLTPPGLSLRTDSPLQYNTSDQTMSGPYQPAPIRSLRTSALESYVSTGSNHSDSPSSSFGGGRIGDSSPEPNAIGGRAAGGQYFNGDHPGSTRGSSFQTTPEIPTALPGRRVPHAESPIDGSMGVRSGALGYGFNSPFGSSQSPWGTPANSVGSGYDGVGLGRDSGHDPVPLQNYASQSLGIDYHSLRSTQDPTAESSQLSAVNYAVGPNSSAHALGGDSRYSDFNLAPGAGDQLYSNAAQQFGSQFQHPSSLDQNFVQQPGFTGNQTGVQSPWPDTADSNLSKSYPFDDSQPMTVNTVTQSSTASATASPWDRTAPPSASIPIPQDASPWVVASHGAVDSAWSQPAEAAFIPDETLADTESRRSPVEFAGAPSEPIEEAKPEALAVEPSPAPAPATPVGSGKSRKQKKAEISVVPLPLPPSEPEAASPQSAAPKPAWQKEEDGKKTVSLREIQEAEAKKAEAKKAAERERERIRAAAPSSQEKEDLQTFTASWGLPTSQAGSRSSVLPTKESVTSPVPASTAAPVWTNAPKIAPTKKTMKEILEEEEKRKKVAPQTTAAATIAASSSGRLYSQTSAKPAASAPASSGGAWTTVGANGKSNPAAAATLPSRPAATTASTTTRANGTPATRPPQPSAVKPQSAPAARVEDTTPSHDFLNWLNDSLKGLNRSVSVEAIMNMLLSFPVEADASVREIISEIIYTNSTTMDGRRFAEEFVSKRKADAKGGPSKGSMKPVSIADVVKAAPKTTQPEWGFKVVNKKKKGGRS